MSSRSENIRFNVYLNDKMAGNNMNSLRKRSRELNSEINKLTIGSTRWIKKMDELKRNERQIRSVRSEMQGTNSTFGKLAQGFNKYFALITAAIAGVAAAVMGLRAISDTITEFEKSLANVLTLLSDADKAEFGDVLSEGSIDIMRRYGFAVKDTNKALFDAVSAGVPAGDAIGFLDQASRLAVGGVTTLATSVDGITTVINAWKLEMDEADLVADAFFSAQKEGKTTVDQLSASIGKIAPVASIAGISYQEILSGMAALTKQGISTAESSTYLRGAINGLIAPGTQAEKVLRDLGVPVGITEIKAAGFTETLTKLNEAFAENPDVVSEAIPNIRGMQAAVALTGEGMVEFQRILEKVNNDIGNNSSLNKAAAVQQESLSQVIARAKANWKATAIELSDFLMPVLRELFSAYSKFNRLTVKALVFMRDNADIIKTFANVIKILVAAWVAYRLQLALANAQMNISIRLKAMMQTAALRASVAYNTLTGNLGRAAAAQRVLNNVTRANPWGLLLSAVVAVGTALYTFSRNAKAATEEQKRLNQELEHFEKLTQDSKGIKEQAKAIDSMTEVQLKRFLSNVQHQIEATEDYALKRKLLESDIAKAHQNALDWVNQMDIDDAKKKEVLARESTWHMRDQLIEQLKEVAAREDALNVNQLEKWREMAQARADAFIPDPDTGSEQAISDEDDAEDPTSTEVDQYQKLLDFIEKTRNDIELATMNSHQREVEQVRLKYEKMYEEAEENAALMAELRMLEQAEIDAVDEKFELEKEEKKAAFLHRLRELDYNDKQKEIEDNLQFYNDLILMAEQFGLDTTDLIAKQKQTEENIIKKYNDRKKKLYEEDLKAQVDVAKKQLDAYAGIAGDIAGIMDDQSQGYKIFASFQAMINATSAALSAFAYVMPIGGPILATLAGAAALAKGMMQVSKINSTEREKSAIDKYEKGGIAHGSKHAQGGIHMIDSQTGRKVGEMEDGEPYMILSDKTYRNNRELIDNLLYNSQHADGAPVQWAQPSATPMPDFGQMAQLSKSFANGGVTHINNITNTSSTSEFKSSNMEQLLTGILAELQKDKPSRAIIDQDGQLALRDALKQFENIEKSAGM